MQTREEGRAENIIFFDGVCSLCNAFINFLIIRDRHRIFHFAPLQGSTANERLPMSRVRVAGPGGPSFTSVVYLKDGVMMTQSDAVIQILADLQGAWRMAAVLRIIPVSLRDTVYTQIATNRYRWFGKRDSCRVPTKEERLRFLD